MTPIGATILAKMNAYCEPSSRFNMPASNADKMEHTTMTPINAASVNVILLRSGRGRSGSGSNMMEIDI